ncbi:hypothetical protein GCM10027449_20560 [Sinomonas notoginsengisoli]
MGEASAGGGWHVGPLPPEPVPPEVLELFDGEQLRLLEGFVLTAPLDRRPGTVNVLLRKPPARGREVLVLLREAKTPDLVDPVDAGGALLFSFEAGAHDDGARLLLLTLRSWSA